MFTEKHYLENITDRELDAYLAKGWYRMGQAIFTCRFIIFQGRLYSSIWVRLPLEGYRFRKNLRKLFKKTHDRFRVVFRPAFISAEKEALYQRYRRQFKGRIAPTLRTSLQDDTDQNIYDTWEVTIYDGNKLVAFSFFDRGFQSVASILGVFDPDYHKYSLGFFTMLAEIDYCQRHGLQFYYPGYVVPGYQKFDYKLRIGQVECYDERLDTWVDEPDYNFEVLPSNYMFTQLQQAQRTLTKRGIPCRLMVYPPYEANLLGYWILDYLEYPIHLDCGAFQFHPIKLILIFDHFKETYGLYYCTIYDDLTDFFAGEFPPPKADYQLELKLLIKEETLIESKSLDAVIEIIAQQTTELKIKWR